MVWVFASFFHVLIGLLSEDISLVLGLGQSGREVLYYFPSSLADLMQTNRVHRLAIV
jgi:hypothetical protein